MAKKRPEILGDTPSYLIVPKGIFRDIDHYRSVIAGIAGGLARSRSSLSSATKGRTDKTAGLAWATARKQTMFVESARAPAMSSR